MHSNVICLDDYRAPTAPPREEQQEPTLSEEEIIRILNEVDEKCKAIDNVLIIAMENLEGLKARLTEIRERYERLKRTVT